MRDVEIAESLAGEQRDLDGAKQLRPSEVRARGVEGRAPALELLRRRTIEEALHPNASIRIDRRLAPQRLEERGDVEAGASDHDRDATARARLANRVMRPLGPLGGPV